MRRSVALLAMVLCGCKSGCDGAPKGNGPAASASAVAPHVTPRDAFAFDVYEQMAKTQGNFVIAPAMLTAVLAPIQKAAKGVTADQMLAVLHAEPNQTSIEANTISQVWTRPGAKEAELLVANRVWLDKGLTLSPEYKAMADKGDDAGVGLVDFRGAPDGARDSIAKWSGDRTGSKSGDVLWPGAVDENVRALITSSVYFTGRWASRFDPARTRLAPFEYRKHTEGMVPTMVGTIKLGYADLDAVEVLELPTEKGDLSLVIVLPKRGHPLAMVEKSLPLGRLPVWRSQLKQVEREVYLPRFAVTTQLGMARALAVLGMTQLFELSADLSGMTTDKTALSELVHKVVLSVDEDGTHPATPSVKVEPVPTPSAPSAVGSGVVPINRTAVDHPFVYAVVDRKSGALLLLGRFVKP